MPCGKFITVEKQLCHAAAGVEFADSDVVKLNSFIFNSLFYCGLFQLLIFIVFTIIPVYNNTRPCN